MDEGLGKRLFDFAVRIIKFCRTLPRGITKEFAADIIIFTKELITWITRKIK